MGLVGDKITVDHWSKFKEIHDHTCMADRETEIMDSQTLAELSEGHKGSINKCLRVSSVVMLKMMSGDIWNYKKQTKRATDKLILYFICYLLYIIYN